MSKPMRALMPQITAFVDALRERGMTDNATLAAGLKQGTFWARENGQSMGNPAPSTETAVEPVTSLAAETRLLDMRWVREQGAGHV